MEEIERYSRLFRRLDKNKKREKIYTEKINDNIIKGFSHLFIIAFVFLVLFILDTNSKIELPNHSLTLMVVLMVSYFTYRLKRESYIYSKKKKVKRFFKKVNIDDTSYKKLKHQINQLEQDEIDALDSRLIDLMIKKETEQSKKNTSKLLNANILEKQKNMIIND